MAMRFGRLQLAILGLAASLSSGCGPSKPSMEAAWAMPAMAPDSDPTSARVDPPGYHFTQGQPQGRGADGVERARGDLPETAAAAGHDMWRTDERRALSEAHDLGVGMVIDFWAEWCDDCGRFDRETFGDPDVRGLLRARFVPLRIDVTEETRRNREQLQRYSVTSLPTVLVLDSHGREIERIDGFVESHAFLARLEAARR